MAGEDWLLDLAGAIADGEDATWERGQKEETDPAMLEALRQLALIRAAHRHSDASPQATVPENSSPLGADPPERWGHVMLRERIGGGAYGSVYRAHDPVLQRDVAVKLVRPSEFHSTAEVERLVDEGRLLAKVKHPNVVTVYGAAFQLGLVGIWMELVRGRTLSAVVQDQGPFGAREASLIGLDVCQALAAVHAVGVLHRDVKAANVMREEGGRIVLMDLGIGRRLDQEGTERDIAGTPLYLAPELLKGGVSTVQSDLYGLGVLLYYLVSGEYPVVGSSLSELRRAHEGHDARLLRDSRPDLPYGFVSVVQRALAPDPANRYRSAGEVEAGLVAGLENELTPRSGEHPLVPAFEEGFSTRKERRRIGPLALGALVTIALIATGWLVHSFSLRPPDASVPAGSRLVLAEIRNTTDLPRLAAITDVLRVQLDQSVHYRLLPTSEIDIVLGQMLRDRSDVLDGAAWREVAWRSTALALVSGNVTQLGDRYRLTLRLEAGETPAELRFVAAQNFDVDGAAGLFDAVDQGSDWLRRQLGEAAKTVELNDIPARDATSSSWQAIDHYDRHFALQEEGDWAGAVDELNRAVELDPQFARAFARLGELHGWADQQKAFRFWEKALRLADQRRLTEKEQLSIENLLATGGDDFERALPLYRTRAERYPQAFQPTFGLAISYLETGNDQEAVDLLEGAMTRWPGNPFAVARLAETYVGLLQSSKARELLEQLRSEQRENEPWLATANIYESRLLFLEGRIEDSLEPLRANLETSSEQQRSRSYSALASLFGELGRLEEADDLLIEGLEVDAGLGERYYGMAARKHLARGWIALRREDLGAVDRYVSEAVALTHDPRLLKRAAAILGRAGLADSIEGLLELVQTDIDVPLVRSARLRLRGELALARGRNHQALQDFEQASAIEPVRRERGYLIRALEKVGDVEEAKTHRDFCRDEPAHILRFEQHWHSMPGFLSWCRG